jgi:TRAP-type mannitol/chloroaromatic compound transport system permease large subunit
MELSTNAVAVIGFVVLFVLMLLRVPVGMAMGLVGVVGYSYIAGTGPALKLVGQTSMRTVTDYTFGVIPMFMLMGAFVSVSGVSRELFDAANCVYRAFTWWLGRCHCFRLRRISCDLRIIGQQPLLPFLQWHIRRSRRYGYPQSFATGVIAAGGTLGAMLPPSTVLAVYAILTQQDIGKLFMAGIVPGLLAMGMYVITIMLIVFFQT